MKASVSDYAQALYETVKANRGGVHQAIQGLVARLQADRKRHWLPLITQALEAIEQQDEGQLVVQVHTARPLAHKERQLIKELRSGDKKVIVREVVDANLIGGIKLIIGDRVIDNSLQTRLAQLQHQF